MVMQCLLEYGGMLDDELQMNFKEFVFNFDLK